MLNVSKGILVRTMVVIDQSLRQRMLCGCKNWINVGLEVRVIARFRKLFRVN